MPISPKISSSYNNPIHSGCSSDPTSENYLYRVASSTTTEPTASAVAPPRLIKYSQAPSVGERVTTISNSPGSDNRNPIVYAPVPVQALRASQHQRHTIPLDHSSTFSSAQRVVSYPRSQTRRHSLTSTPVSVPMIARDSVLASSIPMALSFKGPGQRSQTPHLYDSRDSSNLSLSHSELMAIGEMYRNDHGVSISSDPSLLEMSSLNTEEIFQGSHSPSHNSRYDTSYSPLSVTPLQHHGFSDSPHHTARPYSAAAGSASHYSANEFTLMRHRSLQENTQSMFVETLDPLRLSSANSMPQPSGISYFQPGPLLQDIDTSDMPSTKRQRYDDRIDESMLVSDAAVAAAAAAVVGGTDSSKPNVNIQTSLNSSAIPSQPLSSISPKSMLPSTTSGNSSTFSPGTKRPGSTSRPLAWTKEEENKLRSLVEAGAKWPSITREFPNRSAGAIKKHFYADMKHATWNEEDDSILQQAMREDEMEKWKRIGERIGKTPKSCEKRYRDMLREKEQKSADSS